MFKKMLFNCKIWKLMLLNKFSNDNYKETWWMDVGSPFISQKELESELFDINERSKDKIQRPE